MKKFYMINDGQLISGSGIKVPQGFSEDWDKVATKENGEYYTYYNEDGTADLAKEQAEADAKDKQSKIEEAKAYLASTDFKMTVDYDQDTTEVRVLRQQARELIRSIEG